ncbi:MAG TPA: O-antigen ligase family protein [Saprospiraceae bacterium]|nr:O-antigen ligase family protein [Saprospiraceae bacterium]
MTEQPASRSKWDEWTEAIRAALTSEGVLFLVFATGMVGLFYAKALLSIFSGVIFGVAILNGVLDRTAFRELRAYRAFIALMCIVLLYVISGIHSDDTGRWAKLTWENILYAAIPIGFYGYRKLSSETWRRLLFMFIGISAISALSLMIDYALHFESYNALYKFGKTIPTPITHVRYSFFMALAACIAFALAYEDSEQRAKNKKRRALIIMGVFLTIVVHVLAVRTGLLALYGGLVTILTFVVLRDGRWKLGIASALGVLLLVLIAYNTFPSVMNKIGYVLYDLRMLKEQGALAEYSDNVRITSIRHGLDLVKENLITGTGIGDLHTEMRRMYAEKTPGFPEESRYPPISEFIFILTAFGLVGGALFFFLLLYPLFRTPFNYVLLAIYATTLFAMIGETSIEQQLGKTLFITLVCIAVLLARSVVQNASPGSPAGLSS